MKLPNTLSASAASFQDSWVMDLGGEEAIRQLNPFANGQRGLWRGAGSFALIKDRSNVGKDNYATEINMREDGVFALEAFNWQVHAGPIWVKAASITEYSPYGSEIENKDVLDRYSTALFGYNGQLSTAVGANMRHREMAFTSFEEEALDGANNATSIAQSNSGNFNITNKDAWKLRKVPVLGGNEQVAIIDYPFLEVETLRAHDNITLSGYNLVVGGSFTLEDMEISCKFRDPQSTDQSIVRFSGAGLKSLSNKWKGELSYYEKVEGTVIDSVEAEIVDGEGAHTGTRSLKVKVDFEQVQNFLELEEEKEYVISAWVKVSTGNSFDYTYATTNASAENSERLGIAIKDAAGQYLGVIEPSGTIIDGWQRLQGKFKYPKDAGLISLRFQRGDYSEMLVDDIRFFPNLGNMQSYVYERGTYRLMATLDNNNYATLYSYDSEGNLFLIKKETIEGIKTIQESVSHQKGADNE